MLGPHECAYFYSSFDLRRAIARIVWPSAMAQLLRNLFVFHFKEYLIMSGSFIPDDVARFILEKLDSIAQLEGLLLLRNSPEKQWSVQALAARLYIDEKQTAQLLSDLCKQSLAIMIPSDPPLYQYHPGSTELRNMVDRVAEIYSTHLVPVTALLHSKAKARVQEFADAFKLRKDE